MSDISHAAPSASGHDDSHGHADDGAVHAHVSSVKFYVAIFLGLVMLTVLTVGISYVHLGPANLAVAILIASIKATLVVLFFMHLRYDNKFNGIMFVCSIAFIGVFFAYTMNDTEHRGKLDATQGGEILPSTGQPAPGGEVLPSPTAGGPGATGHGAGASGDHGAPPNAVPAGGDTPVHKDAPAENHGEHH